MKVKKWLSIWLLIVLSGITYAGFWVYKVDPFFHYHNPDLQNYHYLLNNERSQNDGICKHFEYDAIITGSSLTENFKTTEVDELFGCSSIKVPFSGGKYKEINDNIERAIKSNPKIKLVIRGLDMLNGYIITDDKSSMRTDLGKYPTYLYDYNPFNDVHYLLNKDILLGRVYPMILEAGNGITSFDNYARWQDHYSFGANIVFPEGIEDTTSKSENHLTETEKIIIKENIYNNVTKVAENNPHIDFYYFIAPYSIGFWADCNKFGKISKQVEIEKYMPELILPYKNIHLFNFNNRTDIITDLNNYKDIWHYASWINSIMLKWMADGKYQLLSDDYEKVYEKEYNFFQTYDYKSINEQADYENDLYAAALLNKELTGACPISIFNDENVAISLNKSSFIIANDNIILDCQGALARDYSTEELDGYLKDKEFIGAKFDVDLGHSYNYLCFYGQKVKDHGEPTVYIYDTSGRVVGNTTISYKDLDNDVHQYIIDLSAVSGIVTIILNGGYVDDTGSNASHFQFSNVILY